MKPLPKTKFPENVIVFIIGVDYYSKYSENYSLSGNSFLKNTSLRLTDLESKHDCQGGRDS